MNTYDATEISYRNGYSKGSIDKELEWRGKIAEAEKKFFRNYCRYFVESKSKEELFYDNCKTCPFQNL